MKRFILKINKYTKSAMLCVALCGSLYAANKLSPVTRIRAAFTIGLFATVKKAAEKGGESLSDEDTALLKAIDKEINDKWAAYKAGEDGALDKAGFFDFVKTKAGELSAILDTSKIKIGEGDAAKSLDDILKTHGEDITKALLLVTKSAKAETIALKDLFTEDVWKAIEKAFKTKNAQAAVTIGLKAAAIMTTENTLDVSALDGSELENFRVDQFVPKRQERQYIFDIADRTTVAEVPEHILWDEEGDSEGAIAIVEEGELKPLVSLSLVENKSKYKKAAGKMIITEEFAKFRKRAWQIIRSLFNDKVLRDYKNILTTNLLTYAASYVGTALDGTFADPTDYHAIGAVCAQLETLEFNPDTLIINPQDKWRMALTQDANGQFFTNVIVTGANGQISILSLKTITTNKMAVGSFMVGEGGLWKIEDEAVQIRIGYGVTMNAGVAESDFDYNRLRIIGELYFHDYIASLHNGSFVKTEFATVKEALQLSEVVQGG